MPNRARHSKGNDVTATVPVRTPARYIAGSPLRRVPVQGRSLARVQRMLDACAALVDEVGYEGLTTTLLAERAGVAIGSVYQFFPDKRAVVQALSQRNLVAYLERLAERLGAEQAPDWWAALDTAIEEYVHMHRTVPGFRTLHFGEVDAHLLDDERHNNAVIAAHLADLLVGQAQLPDTERLRFALTVAVEVSDALIKFAFRRDPEGDGQVIAEAKTLIRDYLQRQLDPGRSVEAARLEGDSGPASQPGPRPPQQAGSSMEGESVHAAEMSVTERVRD